MLAKNAAQTIKQVNGRGKTAILVMTNRLEGTVRVIVIGSPACAQLRTMLRHAFSALRHALSLGRSAPSTTTDSDISGAGFNFQTSSLFGGKQNKS